MKQVLMTAIAAACLFTTACNNSHSSNEHKGHDMTADEKDSMAHSTPGNAKEIKTIAAAFTALDARVSSSMKDIVDHYIHVKNALVAENAAEAASGAKAMAETISRMDKSLLTAEQKSSFDKIETGLKEHAGKIAGTATDIKLQRSHFVQLSESVYELVKQFGGGRPLYHDHCPMARDNQGAMWISEIKDVKNPYFGNKMLTCGTVEEVIQ
jgi:DNA-binding NtrC family response regulator